MSNFILASIMNSTLADSIKELIYRTLPDDVDLCDGLYICPLMFLLAFVFLADKWSIPNQLVAMLYGSMVGAMYFFVPFLQVGLLYFWKPDNILVLCHPIMIVKVAYSIDSYVFSKSKWQILIVATVGTGIFIFLFGYVMMVMANRDIVLSNIVAAGTTLAAIDVPEVLNELNRIKNLEVIMDGESIFGAALCIMSYSFCIGFYDHTITQWYHVVCLYARYIIVGFCLGFLIGGTMSFLFRFFYRDAFNATVTVLSVAYFTYFVAECYIYCSATISTFFVSYLLGRQRSHLAKKIGEKVQIMIDSAYFSVEFIACISLSTHVTYGMLAFYKGFDFAVAVGVYIMGNVLRILIFLMLSPILSRMGLGFNITSLLTISWAAKRGSLQLLQVIFVSHYDVTGIIGTELLCFTVVYLTLSFVINMSSLRFILRYFGLIEFTLSRKYNISQCIDLLMEKKQRIMFTLKTNRFLSDLNWELIHRATELQNPYASNLNDHSRLSSEFETICPECHKSIPYLRSKEVQDDMLKIVKVNLLKRQRVALVRQFEMNMLEKTDLEIILQFIEMALSSQDAKVCYSYFLNLFDFDQKFMNWKLTKKTTKKLYSLLTWRRYTYKYLGFIRSTWFIKVEIAMIIVNAVFIATWMFMYFANTPYANEVLYIGYGTIIFFTMILFLNFVAFNWESLYLLYFKKVITIFEIVWCLFDIAALISSILFEFHYCRMICLLRLLFNEYTLVLLQYLLRKIIDSNIDKKWAYAYCLGVAIVLSLEEVQAQLHSVSKIESVRSFMSLQVQREKMQVMDKLAMVQMKRPMIAVKVSTYYLKMALLKVISSTALEIHNTGLIELGEYRLIRQNIQIMMKKIHPNRVTHLNSSQVVLKEIPWIGADRDMLEYLYSNMMLRVWEKGDIICSNGDFVDGVMVITRGLLKMTYIPDETALRNLEKYGMLPVVELIRTTHFEEPIEEYLIMGNTVGELGFLTRRPYNCKIEAIRSTSGLIITRAVLLQANEFNTDPINGLFSRMWKSVANGMLWRMLSDKIHKNNTSVTSMHSLLNQAFIPNIDHYRVLHVSSYIDDIFLIDGMITDNRNMEEYKAPCHIPRTVHQFQVKCSKTNVKTKIVILPRNMTFPKTVMQATEEMSETDNDPNSTAPIKNEQLRRAKRQTAINMVADIETRSKTPQDDQREEEYDFDQSLRYIVSYMTKKAVNLTF